MTHYLVTGASGFIGVELVKQLVAQGEQVTTMHRGVGLAGFPEVNHFRCDLGERNMPPDLFDGIDIVVHLAGCAHQSIASVEHERVNVEGTIKLARSAAAAGLADFVFVSSVKAMGPAGESMRDEDDLSPPQSAYGRSKLAAEEALAGLAEEGAMGEIGRAHV